MKIIKRIFLFLFVGVIILIGAAIAVAYLAPYSVEMVDSKLEKDAEEMMGLFSPPKGTSLTYRKNSQIEKFSQKIASYTTWKKNYLKDVAKEYRDLMRFYFRDLSNILTDYNENGVKSYQFSMKTIQQAEKLKKLFPSSSDEEITIFSENDIKQMMRKIDKASEHEIVQMLQSFEEMDGKILEMFDEVALRLFGEKI